MASNVTDTVFVLAISTPWLRGRISSTMAVLMNYKRTLEDLGRCSGKAHGGNPYNFPFMSDCVRSDFEGPCSSVALPIPCGDGTCRANYIDCLQALLDYEARRHVAATSASLSPEEEFVLDGPKVPQGAGMHSFNGLYHR